MENRAYTAGHTGPSATHAGQPWPTQVQAVQDAATDRRHARLARAPVELERLLVLSPDDPFVLEVPV
jgi:hypothetical protein